MDNFCLPDTQLYGLIKRLLSAPSVSRAKIKVNGFSMSPFIKDGSIVRLKQFNKKERIHFGDVLAVNCTDQNRVLVHRVIGRKKKRVLLKGDNNLKHDGWFSDNNIIGIVDGVYKNGIIEKKHRLFNFLIAAGSASGLFNRWLFPFLRTTKKALLPN